MITYRAKLTKEGDRWLVEFPDCPGCQTFGESREHALERAQEALDGWLESHLFLFRVPPRPVATEGEPIVVASEIAGEIEQVWDVPKLGRRFD